MEFKGDPTQRTPKTQKDYMGLRYSPCYISWAFDSHGSPTVWSLGDVGQDLQRTQNTGVE